MKTKWVTYVYVIEFYRNNENKSLGNVTDEAKMTFKWGNSERIPIELFAIATWRSSFCAISFRISFYFFAFFFSWIHSCKVAYIYHSDLNHNWFLSVMQLFSFFSRLSLSIFRVTLFLLFRLTHKTLINYYVLIQ